VDGDHGIASIEVKGPSLWATWNALGVAWLKRFIPEPTARVARPPYANRDGASSPRAGLPADRFW